MSLDDIAKAIYQYRSRRVTWDELGETGWKGEFLKMAEAAVRAIDADPMCPRCVFNNAVLDLVDAGEFILMHGEEHGDELSPAEQGLLSAARRWAANDAIERCLEDHHGC